MIRIYDYTSNSFMRSGQKRIKKETVEAKIKAFAVEITDNYYDQELVNLSRSLDLTAENLSYADEGDYLTFGVDSYYDVSYEETTKRSLESRGVKVVSRRKAFDLIEDMAEKKEELTLIDALRVGSKTYRELAINHESYKKDTKKKKSTKRRKPVTKGRCVCDIDSDILVSDHYIVTEDFIGMKNPNDLVNIYL